jgi:Asp-tRNA(Asn)/Glu-tRNA(Gln) amidotransferase A subunit family amidase
MKNKLILVLIIFCGFGSISAQTIDTSVITIASRLIGLNFTPAEKDSMVDRLRNSAVIYERMHAINLANSQPYPLAFSPAPIGYTIPTKQLPVSFKIPAGVAMPANINELAFYSIPQLASLIKSKKISSVTLTKFFLERLKKWGDTLHCVVSLTEDIAMSEAQQADDDLKKGLYHGPLHGIPYGLKDLFSVKGTHTTWGAAPYKDQVLDEDAFAYTQLHKAGAVLCAKLSMGSLAMGDLWFGGMTRSPWNTKFGSSGSSAGSASATAAGLLPFAIGTETQGSIVSPSNACGATGLRPTFGSISRSGAMVLCWSLDKLGPICRSAEDAAIVFYYLKGTDGKDASAVNRSFNYSGQVKWEKLRIAFAGNLFKNLPPTASQRKVLEVFTSLGANLKEINFPDSILYPFNIITPILNAESAAAFDDLTRSNQDDLLTGQKKNDWPNSFRSSRFIPAVEYINANRHRYALMSAFYNFMKDYDVLIVPSFAGRQLAITNLTGNPVVCMPVGFLQTTGMPESITLLGNLYDEATILAAAKAYQDATDFNKKHPEQFMK